MDLDALDLKVRQLMAWKERQDAHQLHAGRHMTLHLDKDQMMGWIEKMEELVARAEELWHKIQGQGGDPDQPDQPADQAAPKETVDGVPGDKAENERARAEAERDAAARHQHPEEDAELQRDKENQTPRLYLQRQLEADQQVQAAKAEAGQFADAPGGVQDRHEATIERKVMDQEREKAEMAEHSADTPDHPAISDAERDVDAEHEAGADEEGEHDDDTGASRRGRGRRRG